MLTTEGFKRYIMGVADEMDINKAARPLSASVVKPPSSAPILIPIKKGKKPLSADLAKLTPKAT